MKQNRILILTLTIAAAFALPATTFAAKGAKPAKGEAKAGAKAGRPGKVLKTIDANANHLRYPGSRVVEQGQQ